MPQMRTYSLETGKRIDHLQEERSQEGGCNAQMHALRFHNQQGTYIILLYRR